MASFPRMLLIHPQEYIRREALLGPAALDGWLVRAVAASMTDSFLTRDLQIKGQTNLKSLKESLVAVRHKLSSPTS